MSEAQTSYRKILKQEFEMRCQRNPLYSLRAFARDLDISPARLCEIFANKQGLSVKWAGKIAIRLGYGAAEKQYFCDLVEAEGSKSEAKRKLARVRLAQREVAQTHTLQMDAFRIISDWYHYGLLELTMIRGFKSDPVWIARRLGIGVSSAKLAIERLIRLELLEQGKDGALIARTDFTASPDGIPSASLKKYHQQIIEKALSALHRQSVSERDITNVIFAFDRAHAQKAKELIRKFRRSFTKQFPATAAKDSVYCLSIQFFQLDEPMPKGGEV